MLGDKVVARIGCAVAWRTVADLKVGCRGTAAIDEAMSGAPVREANAVPGPHHRFTVIVDQRDLAFNHEDKFVLDRVTMEQGGDGAWRQRDEIDPKGRYTEPISQHAFDPPGHAGRKGLGIDGRPRPWLNAPPV